MWRERERDDILPADAGRHDAQRLPAHLVHLVRQQQARRPALGPQRRLAVPRRPLELLRRHQYLAERRVDQRLARVEARGARNDILVVDDKPGPKNKGKRAKLKIK